MKIFNLGIIAFLIGAAPILESLGARVETVPSRVSSKSVLSMKAPDITLEIESELDANFNDAPATLTMN